MTEFPATSREEAEGAIRAGTGDEKLKPKAGAVDWMPARLTDVTQLDGYVLYSREVALTRLVLVACFVIVLAVFTPWHMAVLGMFEFALYLALFAASEVAARDPDPVRAFRRLRWQSDVLMGLLVANACWLAIQIRLYDGQIMQVEAALLAICVLLFAALRVHITPVSYVIGVVPPALTLIWIAIDWSNPLMLNHYAVSMTLFVAAVMLVTSRQQASDRTLTRALRDLTRKNAALTQAMDEAKTASRAKTDLLAVASHEIRTPLNAVLGFAQILRDKDLNSEQAELLSGVLEGGEQLTRLLDGILDLAHVEGGQARLNPVPVDLRRMIYALMRVWSVHARGIGVDFKFEDADPTLSFLVRADAVRIEQTLVNLISNAMGATAAGGCVTIRLAGTPRGQNLGVLVEVEDTGPAVPPEDRPRLFEAFDQTARGRQQGGSGLGLAICARNTALMGGEIGISDPAALAVAPSVTPQGAVFWFTFDAPGQTPSLAAPTTAARATGQIRLLAAEDNAANRKVLALLLKESPVSLTFAENGAQALDAWRAQPFDLILMDVNMPVLNGLDAVREIRSAEPPGTRMPIWMLTANVFDDDIARYRQNGADGVLRKPIDVPALFTLLAHIAEERVAEGLIEPEHRT